MTQRVSSVSLENPVESFPSSIIAVVHGVVKLNETDRCYQWCWFTQDHLNAHIGHKAHAPWRAKLICFQNGFPLVSFELLVNKVPNILADNLSSKSIAPRAKLRRVKSLISNRSATAYITRKTMADALKSTFNSTCESPGWRKSILCAPKRTMTLGIAVTRGKAPAMTDL